ncbi:MAG: PKD domain-containing protein [Alphaproteobacteria bacterium]|nr:PKD domain-containing protein [Alphaproteobacteria bacterium]
MSRCRTSSLLALVFVPALIAGTATAQEPATDGPRLVTFGSRALQNEGDHDFRQFIRILVPDNAGQLHVRVFDPDVGGLFDEAQRGFNTKTRFSLYGDGATVRLYRDSDGVVQEEIEGEALDSVEFGFHEESDGQWVTLFPMDTSSGRADGSQRQFVLAVEGLSGNDGNVFDVMVSQSDMDNVPVEGAKLTSYAPTLQAAEEGQFAELRFVIPDGATSLMVENFDSAGGGISYAGRFHSAPLTASQKSVWQRDRIELRAGEAGRAGSVIKTGGEESPNDVTVVVSVPADDPGAIGHPVAIELPIRTVKSNVRPYLYYNFSQSACGEMTFDASDSFDDGGTPLSFRWYFDGDDTYFNGRKLVHRFDRSGDHHGRLEIFDGSGVVANGRAVDFSFYVKPPPVAAIDAPVFVAQGAEVRFDGTGSSTARRPADNRITRYHWRMGDGGEIVQNEGDADFGRPVYRFRDFGNYTVELTVTDRQGASCNTAMASHDISVNAPPVARAGGDRELLTGEIGLFDGTSSSDPDGSIASFWWDFGDGKKIFRPTTRHAFHRPGTYQVRLTVIDDTVYETAAHTDLINVTVRDPANERPTARAGEDRVVAMGETVSFDGSTSADPDGRILFYLWDFGNGHGDDEPVVRHTYWEPGTYSVNLTVKDENETDGGQSVDSLTVEVVPADNRPPVLDFPAELTTTLHEPVRFDASKANDRDGNIVSYEWDFGDGAIGTGAVTEHRYDKTGTYRASLVLTDNGIPAPQTTEISFDVQVTNRANTVPAPNIRAETKAKVREPIAFDASETADPDGSILSYVWDFGDGHRASGIETHHIYQFPGRYEVTLTVTDDDVAEQRLTASTSHMVEVALPENKAPAASAGADLVVGRGEIIQFDGSGSSDEDGNVMAYAWDFGDGGTSPDARPVHAFHDTGTYQVELTVTDDGTPTRSGTSRLVVTVIEDGDGRASK